MLILLHFSDRIVCAEHVFSFVMDDNKIHIVPHLYDFHFTQVYYDEYGNENVDKAYNMPEIPTSIVELKKGFTFEVKGIEVFHHDTLAQLLDASTHFDELTKKPTVVE